MNLRRRVLSSFALLSALLIGASVASAQTTNFVVTPSSISPGAYGTDGTNITGNHAVGVLLDSAPGFPSGSFASDGIAKTDIYFTPESLFGREVTLGEIASISYWTKKGTTHAANPADWFLNIYTKRYTGQLGGSFYGVRVGTEPYLAENIVDPVNTWNQWSTDEGNNQLRFFESTYGYFGSYTDPHLDAFVAGTSLSGTRGPGVPYATQPILFFSPQTASGSAAGFTGQLDGLRIELTDGSVASINFEAVFTPTSATACKKDGWKTLNRSNGSVFSNQGDCIQYFNTGK